MIKYVKQEEKYGCVIACLAMILGKSYSEIKALLPSNRGYGERNGMDSHDYISFMFTQGFVGMTVHACESHTQKIRHRSEWVKPVAEINIVSAVTENGPHALVWVKDKIYDPDKPGTFSIDQYAVIGITGFWNLNKFT